MICPIDGSPIIKATLEGGEVERACFAASHIYLTEREIKERDAFLERLKVAGRPAQTPVWKEAS